MNILSVSSNNRNNSLNRIKNIDNEIKLLEKQKLNVQEQISKVREGKASEDVKRELIKPLEEQIRILDQQIQQEQMDKIKKDDHKDGKNSLKKNSNNTKADKNSIKFSDDTDNLVNAGLTYSKIKTAHGIKVKISGESKILKMEAKMDMGRGKFEIAEKKELKASNLDMNVNKLDKNIAKENKKIKNIENHNTTKPEKEDTNSHEINHKTLDVLA